MGGGRRDTEPFGGFADGEPPDGREAILGDNDLRSPSRWPCAFTRARPALTRS